MSRLSVTLGDARLQRVTAYAASGELRVGELVRRALDLYMDAHPIEAQVSRGPMQGTESTYSEAGTKRGGEAHHGCDGVVVAMPVPAPPPEPEPAREENFTATDKRAALRAWEGDDDEMPAPVYVERCLQIFEDAGEADVPFALINQWSKAIGQQEVLALLRKLAPKGHLSKGIPYIGGCVNRRRKEIEGDEAETRKLVERDVAEQTLLEAKLTPEQRAAEFKLAQQRRAAAKERLAAKGIHVG